MRFARENHHLMTTAALRRSGLSYEQISDLADDGVIQRAAHAIYRLPGTRSPVQDAAVVALRRPGSVISCSTGLFLHGFDLLPPRSPHFLLPPSAGGSTAVGHLHRSPLDSRDITVRAGIRVTTPARSLVDAAMHLSSERLASLLDEGAARALLNADEVRAAATRAELAPGRRGLGRLRRALEPWEAPICPESPAEAAAIRRIHEAGLPAPDTQLEVWDDDGFVARIDLAWPTLLVGRAYDSSRYHGPSRIEQDEIRRRRLEALGWIIRSIDRTDLRAGESAWLHRLRADLASRSRRAS